MTDELERKIRMLERKLQTAKNIQEQLKSERNKALDKYYEASAIITKLENNTANTTGYNETLRQYKKIRSAFDRNKANHKSIIEFLEQNNIMFKGKKLSVSTMMKEGKNLLSMEIFDSK